MKISYIVKRLSNPRVRRRLKIGLSVWFGAMLLGVLFKVVYDVGYFNAQKAAALKHDEHSELPATLPVLTKQIAQRIVTGALKEDFNNPKTVVEQIVDDNPKLATIIIENNKVRQIARIINMQMFFTCELFNAEGYNLNDGIEYQYNINRIYH